MSDLKVNVKKTVKIQLELSEEMAYWLKGYMQNPMCDPNDEDPKLRDYRNQLFNALPSQVLTR